MVRKIGEYILNSLCLVSGMFVLWCLFSWLDVVLHNLDPDPVYQCWNLFMILFN